MSSIATSALYCRIRLMVAKSFSIGFNSGEYGGKNSKLSVEYAIIVNDNISLRKCKLIFRIYYNPGALELDISAKTLREKVQAALRAEGVPTGQWQWRDRYSLSGHETR